MQIDAIINQKILLQTSNHPTPHLETELEIMQRLLEQGNTIYWIICKGNFQTCFHNPEHKLMHCQVCHSRVINGLNTLKSKVESHQNLHLLTYDEFLTLNQFKKAGYPLDLHFEDIQLLKKHEYKSYDNGLATMSSLVSFTRNHEPDLIKHKDFIYRGLLTGAYLYETFQLVLNKINPDLVILFNGRFIENRPLLRVCEQRKINYATHERGGKMHNFLFRVNSIPHSFDTISKEIDYFWNNATNDKIEIGKKFFERRINRIEDAWYSFTKNQNVGQLPSSFETNKNKKIVTIFNSSLDEYEGLAGFGPRFYANDNEGIRQIGESLKDFPDVKLYLRVHPNLKGIKNSQNAFIKDVLNPMETIEVIPPEDTVDTYKLVEKSDIILVFTTTVGVEAAYANKKVVLLGRAAYESLNCAVIPKSHEELMTILTDNSYVFPTVNPEEPLKYGYWNQSFGIDYKYYVAKSISKGEYLGKSIKANFILRRMKRFVKWFS